jgi:lysyl-tRNA synthetase class 2
MDLTEELLRAVSQSVLGTTTVQYVGETIDFAQPIERLTLLESIQRYGDFEDADLRDRDALRTILNDLNVKVDDGWGVGKLQMELFEVRVEERLMQPTFITAYPAEVSPLARRSEQDPDFTDRFELFVGGREIANGFSELNDSEDQARRFADQVERLAQGDNEAMHFDQDYVTALEHGLPPTAGEGIGVDRLVMLLTDSNSIREVLLFPHMRPEQ